MARKTSAVRPKSERVQDERLRKFQEQQRARARYASRRSSGRMVSKP
jgi:hypothetical protein